MTAEPPVIVVPCYNEASRLAPEAFLQGAAALGVRLIFVNDGSRDGTADVLRQLCARAPDRLELLQLPENRGKAEAVRAGLQRALARGAQRLGYLDADLSTPFPELARILAELERADAVVAAGSRVLMMGYAIRRHARRHYLGRVFATGASLSLRLPIYDTQCGAKIFRRTAALVAALDVPFKARWAFDVELLGRLIRPLAPVEPVPAAAIVEVPLRTWADIPGSRVAFLDMVRMGLDLVPIWWRLRGQGRSRRLASQERPP